MAEAADRDPREPLGHAVWGAADPAALASYHEAGIHRALLAVPDLSPEEIRRVLDQHAPWLRKDSGALVG